MIVRGQLERDLRGFALARPNLPDVIGVGARLDKTGLYVDTLAYAAPTHQKAITLHLITNAATTQPEAEIIRDAFKRRQFDKRAILHELTTHLGTLPIVIIPVQVEWDGDIFTPELSACHECQGAGCPACNDLGRSYRHAGHTEVHLDYARENP